MAIADSGMTKRIRRGYKSNADNFNPDFLHQFDNLMRRDGIYGVRYNGVTLQNLRSSRSYVMPSNSKGADLQSSAVEKAS